MDSACLKQDSLGVFGGTFDPVHCGHTGIAQVLLTQFPLSEMLFLPNKVPPHRPQPEASGHDRFEMLKRATQGEPTFSVSAAELDRQGLSFTEVTLANLRKQQGPYRTIFFFLGSDALVGLDSWFRWKQLLKHAHLVVCQRVLSSEAECSDGLKQFIRRHAAGALGTQQVKGQNGIFFANTPLFPITATEIRQRLKKGLSCENYLDPAVLTYIDRQRLYRS